MCDVRTCVRADVWTCGRVDVWTCGRADVRTCGRVDVRTSGSCGRAVVVQAFRPAVVAGGLPNFSNVGFAYRRTNHGPAEAGHYVRATCGRADVRTCGRADVRTCGRADVWTCGRADVRTYGSCGRAVVMQAFRPAVVAGGLPNFSNVGSAYRRTNHGPAEAGHYVRADVRTCGRADDTDVRFVRTCCRSAGLQACRRGRRSAEFLERRVRLPADQSRSG